MPEHESQARHRPVIRVFVSSTFTDLKHERDALQREVFPKLERLCASRQFQFQAIDLRWGVPTEASLDHRTMRICFEELRRSQEISPQPNFLVLLGNRYGWRPLPEEVSEEEFQILERAATSPSAMGILGAWYRRDENAVPPVHHLQSRKQNLNDGRDYTDDLTWNEVQHILWAIINDAYPVDLLSGRFENLSSLDQPLPACVRFQGSATEQEIWRGALGASNASEHVLAFVREIENGEEFPAAEMGEFVDVDESGEVDSVAQGALSELKEELARRIGEDNIIGTTAATQLVRSTNENGETRIDVTTGHLDELCERVHAEFEAVILRQINAYWGTSGSQIPSARELELENKEHQRFGDERAPASSFVGRERHLDAIRSYVQGDSDAPLAIHGASGCGKTALLARAAQGFAPESNPIVRFIGVTPRSSDVRSLLVSLCQELRVRHPLDSPLPTDIRELILEFHDHLGAATAEEPVILVLDALDQLADTDNGRLLRWIPSGPLPSHVKLIVSCLSDRVPDDSIGEPYAALERRRLAEDNFIDLDGLSEDEALTLLFDRWLPQTQRELNNEQGQLVRDRLTSYPCRQPLYLRILFEEARLWRSHDLVPEPGGDVPELLGALFSRLSDPANHGDTVEFALGYIASARRGLTELEILEVLYHDPDYKNILDEMTAKTGHELPKDPKRIPIALWSRLRFDLAPYLAESGAPGGTVINFYHRQVAEHVREHFVGSPLEKEERHERLSSYFYAQDYFLESLEAQRERALATPLTARPVNVRKVDELPWQLLAAKRLAESERLLKTPDFLEAKVEAGLVFDLVSDFSAALDVIRPVDERQPDLIVELLRKALRRDVHFIARHAADYPQALFQCLRNTCWWYDCPEAEQYFEVAEGATPPWARAGEKLSDLLDRWWAEREAATPGFHWLRACRPPFVHLGEAQQAVLRGYEGEVYSVSFSPDGSRIVSGSLDETVRIWDAETGAEQFVLCGHEDAVWSVSFSPDSTRIVSGSEDKTVRIWDAETGAEQSVLRGHEDAVWSVSFSPDSTRIVSGSVDKTVRLWDAESYAEQAVLRGHEGYIKSVSFSPNGTRVVSGSLDETVRIWDAETGAEQFVLCGHEDAVWSVSFSPDSTRIVSGSDHMTADPTVRIWDAETGSEQSVLRGHERRVSSVSFSPDGSRIVSGSLDETVRIWDAETGAEQFVLRGHEDAVWSVSFSPDSTRIVSGSSDTTVRLWDAESTSEPAVLRGHKKYVADVSFNLDGTLLASGSDDGTVRVWDAETGVETAVLKGHELDVTHVLFSCDRTCIVSASRDKTMRVWNAETGAHRAVLNGHEGYIKSVSFSPNGTRVVSGSEDKTVRIWDAETGAEQSVLRGHEDAACSVSFSPDSTRIVSSSEDKTVRIWDAETGEVIEMIDGTGDVTAVAEGPNDKPILALAREMETKVFRSSDGTTVACFAESLSHSRAHPGGYTWAGSSGSHVHLITLEGSRPADE